MSKLFKTVEDYIKNVPKDEQGVFIDLREAIKEAAPEAEELISYQIPTYKFHGPLVHFKSGANYLSFICVNKNIIDMFAADLKNFKTSGTTIRFTADNPLPRDLVIKIVNERVKQNQDQ